MDSRSRKLLEALEAMDARDRGAIGPPGLTRDFPGDSRALAEDLAAQGLLRRAEDSAAYRLTEAGRLALAAPLDVTLYTRPGCHLCDETKADISPLLRWAGARLREVNIDADPELRERYDVDVPVIFLGSRKVAKHRVDLSQFRRQLEDARRQSGAPPQ